MSQRIIDSLIELEVAAANRFWQDEDRSAWKDEILRLAENKDTAQLKPHLTQSPEPLRTGITCAQVLVGDEDLKVALMRRSHDKSKSHSLAHQDSIPSPFSSQSLSGIYLRPGFWVQDTWYEQEQQLRTALSDARSNGTLVFRNGFFNQMADILLTADLGFSGIQIHVHNLDLYELQMAIELARDCRLCPIISAAGLDQLELAIQTDAPHLGLCFFPDQDLQEQLSFVQRAIPRIPEGCSRILFGSILDQSEMAYFSHLQFDAVFQFNSHLYETS